MAFKLASLFVEIGGKDNGLRSLLAGVRGGVSATSVALGNLAASATQAFARMAVAVPTDLFKKAITSASDLAETTSKVQQVFGTSTDRVTKQANRLADTFGLQKREMLDAASAFGLIGKGAGQSAAEAAKLANQMAMLAADASSFYNTSLEVALEKIRSGLVGESEPLRAFGVMLNEDAVKAEALALGLNKGAKELSESAKVMARASLIAKGLKDATGDLARTQGGFANQARMAWGRFENTLADIGAAMLPAVTTMMEAVNRLSRDITASLKGVLPTVQAFADRIASSGKYIALLWREFPTVLQLARLKAEQLAVTFGVVADRFAGGIGEQLRFAMSNAAKFIDDLFKKLSRNIAAYIHNDLQDMLKRNAKWIALLNPGLALAVGGLKPMGFEKIVPGERPEFRWDLLFKNLPDFAPMMNPLWGKLERAFVQQGAEAAAGMAKGIWQKLAMAFMPLAAPGAFGQAGAAARGPGGPAAADAAHAQVAKFAAQGLAPPAVPVWQQMVKAMEERAKRAVGGAQHVPPAQRRRDAARLALDKRRREADQRMKQRQLQEKIKKFNALARPPRNANKDELQRRANQMRALGEEIAGQMAQGQAKPGDAAQGKFLARIDAVIAVLKEIAAGNADIKKELQKRLGAAFQ